MPTITDARVLIIAADGFEQSELMVPLKELRAAGARVEVASPDGKAIRGWKDKNWGETLEADAALASVRPENYDALVIPGGQMNPDVLRADKDAMAIVRAFLDGGKVVAAICHGPWLLVEADAVRGRTVTSYASIRTDVINAGGKWVDRDVAADQGIITSRSPADLKAFVGKIVEEIGEGRHERRKVA
ncbi:type 1 glutamine amidotransferase [Starkeya koreensis]|uniref:Type 1 glutamine amidotransferase n=1 Tax=Ancylobacter koreensis TaxID=266121 RepID=A0ABT0DMN3_9HYPH|nr:type 1 glutamine amidotransferase domain-containing protein [Ancylobacter koreensis]MCK0208537.1 type 1 glutamine amidotransferase [Ancylobacter koreensis]